MPQMTYYRRPQLAGKSIRYITSAAVRGNVRRNDVDGIVPYPYFSNIAPNSTLVVESWDPVNENLVQATAVFSSTQAGNERIDVLLAELNSALTSIKVTAFDDGGCVGLRSQYAGGDSLVRVVGQRRRRPRLRCLRPDVPVGGWRHGVERRGSTGPAVRYGVAERRREPLQ